MAESELTCGGCDRDRTEEDRAARVPCPDCGSTSFNVRVFVETGHISLAGLNVSVQTILAFESAKWKAIFREMDLAELRAVCEGSKNQTPDIPEGYELDVQAIAKHVYDERIGRNEWQKPHVWVPILIAIVAVVVALSLAG